MTAAPVSVITGAASGIGAACAEVMRRSGWATAGIDLNPSGTGLPLRAAFLAGPGSSAVVGQILQPNGGVTRTRA